MHRTRIVEYAHACYYLQFAVISNTSYRVEEKRMISNQILQNTIEGLKGISRVDFCVLDTEGKELAATFDMAKDCGEAVLSFVESPADSQVIQGCQFFKIFDEQRLEYVLLADGETEDVYMLGKIAAFQIQSLLVAYKERFDKDNFIKNLLLDNLLSLIHI